MWEEGGGVGGVESEGGSVVVKTGFTETETASRRESRDIETKTLKIKEKQTGKITCFFNLFQFGCKCYCNISFKQGIFQYLFLNWILFRYYRIVTVLVETPPVLIKNPNLLIQSP